MIIDTQTYVTRRIMFASSADYTAFMSAMAQVPMPGHSIMSYVGDEDGLFVDLLGATEPLQVDVEALAAAL